MQSNSDNSPEPVLEVIEGAVPEHLHQAAWEQCMRSNWCFGHGSHGNDWSRFWKMDLDGNPTFDAIWEHVRPKCEALAGGPLRVVRQYANGHTYGLGGQPHKDDERPGTFTFLYYPNPEWKDGWDGETVYFDAAGEIAFTVRPRPNRAVFFDSRIPHAGRAPGRMCPVLRVTVAFKLELASSSVRTEDVECTELAKDGATHVYSIRISEKLVKQATDQRLTALGKTVRLPGFAAGKIPAEVLMQRYGADARRQAVNQLASEAVTRVPPRGSVPATVELKKGAEAGDLEFHVKATLLSELPQVDASQWKLERLTLDPGVLAGLEISESEAGALLENHLKMQVMDRLDSAYRFPVLEALVKREYETISASVVPATDPQDRQAQSQQLKGIAERRLRLGFVIAELARRNQIQAHQAAELEARTIEHLIAQAEVRAVPATAEQIRELMKD